MITETAEIEAALKPLRARGIPISLPKLVIRGAEATIAEARESKAEEERRRAARERFLHWTSEGAPGLDLDLSRPAWKRPSIEKLLEEP